MLIAFVSWVRGKVRFLRGFIIQAAQRLFGFQQYTVLVILNSSYGQQDHQAIPLGLRHTTKPTYLSHGQVGKERRQRGRGRTASLTHAYGQRRSLHPSLVMHPDYVDGVQEGFDGLAQCL